MNVYQLIRPYMQVDEILEVGCGEGFNLRQSNAKRKVGIDAFLPILQKYEGTDNTVRLHHDLSLGIPFSDKTFNTVFGMDIIEHFEKDEAFKLISECERVAQDYVFFFVPVGNHPQTTDDRNLGNDYFQTHRSSWYPKDLDEIGYEVIFDANHFRHPLGNNKESGAMLCIKKIK